MSQIQAKARVQLTVEVAILDGWGDDCAIGQLYKQAADAAKTNLINSLKPGEHGRVTIIGEPRVVGIITDKKE